MPTAASVPAYMNARATSPITLNGESAHKSASATAIKAQATKRERVATSGAVEGAWLAVDRRRGSRFSSATSSRTASPVATGWSMLPTRGAYARLEDRQTRDAGRYELGLA